MMEKYGMFMIGRWGWERKSEGFRRFIIMNSKQHCYIYDKIHIKYINICFLSKFGESKVSHIFNSFIFKLFFCNGHNN